jgi:tetratricopeptide (TPR) repeat protein
VAVLHPKVTLVGDHPELAFVASEVAEATLSTLISLQGLQPIDPPGQEEESGSEAERLRSIEADEALLPFIDCRGNWCQVVFRRLRKPGGEVLATVGPFEIPVGLESSYQLADGVRVGLQKLYPDRRLREGAAGARVRPEDYSAYIELELQVDGGKRLGKDDLAELDALLRTSPDLVGAYVLAAGIARNLGAVGRALAYVTQAEKIAPYDPAPLFERFRVEIEGNRLDAASITLARLEHLAPGDIRVQSAKAGLLGAQGELEEARRLWEEVARRRPTWRTILEVVMVEFRLGESDAARQRLSRLLAAQPDNQVVRENVAAVEASFGDLRRAAALYEDLNRARPTRPNLTNLGFVRFVLGDYAAAAAAYRNALTLEPQHRLTRFSLAAALEAQGEMKEARNFYRTLALELAATSIPLDARTRMIQAQCLARLGQRKEAERLAEEALEQGREDVQVLHQAAQLYALLGDRVSARFYAKLARKKGMRREWFTIPEFRSLEEDPEFRALLDSR